MAKINVLEKHLAELIAAGEVVERPASAVKELIENAIDAGASVITVEIQNGGVSFLRVTDNGSGIAREEVPLAFLRHATSKINTQEDLAAIGTLGFRGEALASICAMARVEMITRTKEELAGTHYMIEGGDEVLCEDAGCPVGTTVIVRDLFFNTPARMKFLKKDVSEGNAVAGVVDKAALSHPEISFRLIRDGKEVLRTAGDGQLKSAIFSVYGRQFVLGLIPVEYSLGSIQVSGFLSRPADARPSRTMQNFFINGRFVKSKTAGAAVDEAGKGSVMTGKYLSCVLHLTIPAEAVDVNVHPSKIEVRFITERPIFDAVYHAVKSALTKMDAPVPMQFEQPTQAPPAFSVSDRLFTPKQEMPKLSLRDVVSVTPPQLGKNRVEERLPVSQKQTGKPVATEQKEPILEKENTDYVVEQPPLPPFQTKAAQQSTSKATLQEEAPLQKQAPSFKDPAVLSPKKAQESAPLPTQTETFLTQEKPLRFVGELFGTYIVLEAADTMVLIDKHAAHERILYEKLKQTHQERYAQQLLVPVAVTLDKESYSALLSELELLSKAGFEVEDFGGGTVLVRSAPLSFEKQDITDALFEIAAHLMENRRNLMTEQEEWVLHNIACRAAIKGGDRSSNQELIALAQQLHENPQLRYCPHGRPIYLSITKKELEKQFGRI